MQPVDIRRFQESGFERLRADFEAAAAPDATVFAEYAESVPKLLKESSPAALDAALLAASAFVAKGPAGAADRAAAWVPALFKKALTGRPSTKRAAFELAHLLMEVDGPAAAAEHACTSVLTLHDGRAFRGSGARRVHAEGAACAAALEALRAELTGAAAALGLACPAPPSEEVQYIKPRGAAPQPPAVN